MANKKSNVRVADKPAYPSWAKTVWFAGLGLVSTVEESGVNVLRSVSKTGMTVKEKLQAEADAVITDLVKRGERLEKKGLETIGALRKDATERGKESIDAFDRMVAGLAEDTLNRIEMPTRSEIRSLAEKVRSLTSHVDVLSSRLSAPALNAPAIDKAVYMVRFDEAGWTLEKEGSELPMAPVCTTLRELGPLEVYQVRRTGTEALFNALIDTCHYLGYTQPVGESLKYLVFADGRPVAALAWASSPRHLGCRDRYLGWSPAARRRNIRLLAYNTRFLILPWVEVPHLASHLLGRITRALSNDWQHLYAHPVVFVETFVDPQRFRGTCYRAANWVVLGRTTGRGKDDQTHRPNRPIKEVLGYALTPRFRELLSSESL